jgi:hypothetical protein
LRRVGGRIEHLDRMRRRTRGGERVEEGFEYASLLRDRSNRFHTLFQCPNRSGSARGRTFSTAKK